MGNGRGEMVQEGGLQQTHGHSTPPGRLLALEVCKTGLIPTEFIYLVRNKKYFNKLGKIFLQIGKNISRFKDVSVDDSLQLLEADEKKLLKLKEKYFK